MDQCSGDPSNNPPLFWDHPEIWLDLDGLNCNNSPPLDSESVVNKGGRGLLRISADSIRFHYREFRGWFVNLTRSFGKNEHKIDNNRGKIYPEFHIVFQKRTWGKYPQCPVYRVTENGGNALFLRTSRKFLSPGSPENNKKTEIPKSNVGKETDLRWFAPEYDLAVHFTRSLPIK